jgi:phage terminase large subunit
VAARTGYLAEKFATYEQRAWDRKMLSMVDSFVKAKEDRDLVKADYSAYLNDPVGFFRDVLNKPLWSRQAEIADAIVDHAQVAVKTGHKIGKSLMAAGLALWWACTRPEALVIVTAPSYEGVKDMIWKELHNLHRTIKADVGGVMPLDPNTGLALANGSVIKGLTTNTPERVAGRSGQSVFLIVDEASGYPDALMEALQTSTAGGDDDMEGAGEARLFAIGNPTQTSGWFFEIFRTANPDWSQHTVSSEETPNARTANDNGEPLEKLIPGLASRSYIERMRRQYGPDPDTHPIYMVRIKGLYPERSSNSVIGLANVDRAANDNARRAVFIPRPPADVCLGVDPARFGDDDSCVVPSIEKWMGDVESFSGLDGPQLAAEVRRIAATYVEDGRRVRVNIDGAGIGASVVDALIRCDLAMSGKLYICDTNASSKADKETEYLNLRAQLWFDMNQWLADGGSLPKDGELARELLAPTYKFAPKCGRIQVESKDDIKKKIGHSPDRADAACLSVYRGRSGLVEFTSGERVKPAEKNPTTGNYRWKSGGGAL